jgi:hypothetical protein
MYFFDCRQFSDERREMIRLRSVRVTQKFNLLVLASIALYHFFFQEMNSYLILATLVFTTLYGEILSKIYIPQKVTDEFSIREENDDIVALKI